MRLLDWLLDQMPQRTIGNPPDRDPVRPAYNATVENDEKLRAMYRRRLAADYAKRPKVPDLGGGAPGDRFPL